MDVGTIITVVAVAGVAFAVYQLLNKKPNQDDKDSSEE